jgi:hypothetical protein
MGDFLSDIGSALSSVVNTVEGAVNGLESMDPLNSLMNAGASLLNDIGVPKEVTDGLKIAAGACTGDLGMCVDGAAAEAGDISHDLSSQPATTEVASASTASPNGYDTSSGFLPGVLTAGDRQFLQNGFASANASSQTSSGSAPGPNGDCDDFSSILNDPSMSLEDKVMAILEKCYDQTDQSVQGLVTQLGQAQQASNGGQPTSASNASGAPSMQTLEFKLQDMMQKRTQLLDLMSNMSKTFNDAAMTAINNTKV